MGVIDATDYSDWIPSDPRGLGRPLTKEDMDIAMSTGYVIPALRGKQPTVELLLDYVDLKLDWYIPSVEALDFINFIRLCIGEEPQNLNSIAHYFFIDCLFSSKEVEPYFNVRNIDFSELIGNVLILSSREFSKSTLIVYIILFMAAKGKMPGFGKVNFGVYVSDKMEKGNVVVTMNTIEALCKQSKYLMSQFEHTHFTDAQATFIRNPKSRSEIMAYNKHMNNGGKLDTVPQRMKRQFKIQGLGSSGGRGSRDILDRPEFAIYDDMIGNEKDAYSPAYLENIESTMESDVGSSLSGEGNFQILIGTAYHTGDPVYSRVEEGTWLPVVFPKAEVPPHGDIYNKDGELVAPAMTKENFVSVWDDRHSFEKQRAKYALAEKAASNGKPKKLKTINQEFYVRVTSEHERLIPSANILWRNLSHIKRNASNYRWYLTTDYTTTGNATSDDSGAFLWAVDWEEKWYLVDVALRKMELYDQYQNTLDMIDKAKNWGAMNVDVGVEIDGQQSLHIMGLENYAEKKRVWVDFAKQQSPHGKKTTHIGIRSKGNGDKLWRLKLVEPKYSELQVVFNEDLKNYNTEMATFLEELKMTTYTEIKAKSDNGLDCRVAGTQICISNGNSVSIEDIREGDKVLTIGGQYGLSNGVLTEGKTSDVIMTGVKEVSDYLLSNGDIVSCTDNELFMTTDGYMFACDLNENHIILGHKSWKNTESNGFSTVEDTTSQQQKLRERNDTCINTSIGSIQEYGVVERWWFITMTKIRETMTSTTLDCSLVHSIEKYIKMMSVIGHRAKMELGGIKNTIVIQIITHLNWFRKKNVNTAGRNTQQLDMTEKLAQESVQQNCTHQTIKLNTDEQNTKRSALSAQKSLLDYTKQQHVQTSAEQKAGSQIKKCMISSASIVETCFTQKNQQQQYVVRNVMKDKNLTSQYRGDAKQKDAVITSISSMQREDKSIVRKNVNLKIDERIVELVKNNIEEFEPIVLVSVSNRRLEDTYAFEVYDTNNYLSGSGVVMHNCASQMALIDISYPHEPVKIEDESGYNIRTKDPVFGENWDESPEEVILSGYGKYI